MSSKEIVKLLRANTGERDMHSVFSDFCSMSAAALRNRFDPRGHQAREEAYEQTRERYSEAQWGRFAEALALVAIELATEPRDVLGEVYMQLSLLEIPAVVNHRNSLTLEHFDAWSTAAHALGGWSAKLAARSEELRSA